MSQDTRKVPLFAAIAIILGRGMTSIGWLLFGFLMIFGWGFAANADLSFLYFSGETAKTQGKVIEVVETDYEINESSVWANIYEYTDSDGRQYVRDAFITGRRLSVGSSVVVEYPVDKPHLGRVPGTRSSEVGPWFLLFWLLPGVGVLLVYWGIKRGLSDYHLVQRGKLARAKLMSKTATNVQVNEQTVYRLEFEFKNELGRTFTSTVKSHKTAHLEDDEFERLFYDPKNPERSTFVDDLPGAPAVDVAGEIVAFKVSPPIFPILLPVLCVGPHLWYLSRLF